MASPTDANVNLDQPNFNGPVLQGKSWLLDGAWQKFVNILLRALRVIDGGTP